MKRRAIVLQSGGSTAVINQSLAGVIDAVRKSGRFFRLDGSKHGILGVLNNQLIPLLSLKPSAISQIRNSPSSALGSCRKKISPDEAEKIVRVLRQKKIDVLFLIGGNDSAETGLLLSNVGTRHAVSLQIIGIPKTIDNDLPGMDHAPGFGSVARFMAIATQEAALDTRAAKLTDPIKIIETMGRNSGWIVAASALLKKNPEDGPHLLCFPERAFHAKKFVTDVKKIYKRFGYAVIVISETIRDAKGNRIGSGNKVFARDQFGHPYIEGAEQVLAGMIQAELKVRVRFDKPGTIQRMSLPYGSKVDQKEAYGCGIHAVRLALTGQSGVMVAMERFTRRDTACRVPTYRIRYGAIPLKAVAGQEKKMPAEFINREGNFVTPAFRRYALPLIGNGLPQYAFLA